jgi:hypothetical protein
MAFRFAIMFEGIALGLAACSGGAGPVVTTTAGGRDVPPAPRDTPPSTRDGVGNCLVCDVNYECASGGSGTTQTIELRTADGKCTDANIAIVCSGLPFGASGCSGGGGGAFTCGSTTCVPSR